MEARPGNDLPAGWLVAVVAPLGGLDPTPVEGDVDAVGSDRPLVRREAERAKEHDPLRLGEGRDVDDLVDGADLLPSWAAPGSPGLLIAFNHFNLLVRGLVPDEHWLKVGKAHGGSALLNTVTSDMATTDALLFPPKEVRRLILEALGAGRYDGPVDARDLAEDLGLDLSKVSTALSTMAWEKPPCCHRQKLKNPARKHDTFHYMLSEAAWRTWESAKEAAAIPAAPAFEEPPVFSGYTDAPKEHTVPTSRLDSMIAEQTDRVEILRRKLRDAESTLDLLQAVRSGKIVRELPDVED